MRPWLKRKVWLAVAASAGVWPAAALAQSGAAKGSQAQPATQRGEGEAGLAAERGEGEARPAAGRAARRAPAGAAEKAAAAPRGAEVVATEEEADEEGVKTYRFGAVEVEGRLRSPQIIYFLRRVRAEFGARDLGHRSFLRELSDTQRAPAFR